MEDLKKLKANGMPIVEEESPHTEDSSIMGSEEVNDFGDIDHQLQGSMPDESQFMYSRGNSSVMNSKINKAGVSQAAMSSQNAHRDHAGFSDSSNTNRQSRVVSSGSLNGPDLEQDSAESISFNHYG